ncbi:MAG: hypothetical protein LBC85_09990 [Fibromonadaceae bacterium]|nr:hypothetical protein [Fibromonadaceae bacterium]
MDLVVNNVNLLFNLGHKVLQNDKIRIIAGLKNSFNWQLLEDKTTFTYYDPYKINESSNYYHYLTLATSPNILGEIALTNHWLAFVGAGTNISLSAQFSGQDEKIFPKAGSCTLGLRKCSLQLPILSLG